MTTEGQTRIDGRGDHLRAIPDAISLLENLGLPVIVDWDIEEHGPLAEHAQKLYATMGVLVRFV